MGGRAGFTLLELVLALGLLAVVSAQIVGAISGASDATSQDINRTAVEAQARQLLRRIGFAIMGSHPDTLVPDVASPLASTSLRYQVSLGVADGDLIWGNPEEVALEEDASQLYWSENPGLEEERRVVWSNLVAPYLEGEVPNGIDDNGNGLIDEKGLAFSIDRNAIRMHLTLEREIAPGDIQQCTVSTVVTCRNTIDGWRVAE